MTSNWRTVKLQEIVLFKTGKLDSNAADEQGVYPFFTCSPVTLAINNYAFDTEAVLLAGNNANGVFAVKYYNGKFNAYQRTYVITPIDKSVVSVRWLYFRIKHVTSELQQMSVGTATKFLTKKILDAYEVQLPPIEEQERQAKILWDLQNKLDLNAKTNRTLEQMAQAIFKSWFVDFDPVKAKMNGEQPEGMDAATATLFPEKLVESELGLIPEGWEPKQLKDVLELAYGKALKKTDRVDGDVPVYGSGGLTGYHNQSLVDGPGIIVGRKGTVGSVYWEPKAFYPIDTVFYVKPKAGYSMKYCHLVLQNLGLKDMNTDAAVPGLNRNNAYRLDVITPSEAVLMKFAEMTQSFQSMIDANNAQNENLSLLRDTLLPKLLSGEIELVKIGEGD